MRKRKRSIQEQAAKPAPAPTPAFDSPFKGLKGMLAAQRVAPAPPTPVRAPPPAAAPVENEEDLLSAALAGVVPLGGPRPVPLAREAAIKRAIVSEEAEVLATLSDLVAGQGTFDITETEEYVEGARMDLDPRLIVRLRRGEFAFEAYLDMHGMTQPDAHEELARFLRESIRQGRRTVLVVHGKGLGSPGGKGVLKHATVQWLSHGALSAHVLGFVTARPIDGGTGALYVLLQRTRKRAPFDVLNGAKRRP